MFERLKQIWKQADGIPDYHLGPKFNGEGASTFVMNREFGDPVQFIRGAGRIAGALAVLQHPQVYVNMAAKTSGLGGNVVGTLDLQSLHTPEDIGV